MSEPESGQAGRIRAEQSPADEGVARSGSAEVSQGDAPQDSAEETASLLKQLTVGAVIDSKYRIDEIIGRGAMGVVAAATHVHLKERVALKFLSTRAHGQANDFHSRFRREAQVSAKLRNEHITRVIDVGVWHERVPFMVMDHLVGHDLRRTLKQAPNGRLPTAVALDYIVQVCEGLAEAHALGIVHRDLKPSNLFVTKRPDGSELIKILDFGISKWSTQEEQLDELTQTGVVLGSPKYMAPEQLFGSATVDMRADIWSIGAIFYEMLTSRPPYDFPTLTRICAELAADRPPPPLKQFVPDVPPQLEAVLMQCFARDREQRISNVAEFAGALLDAVDAPFAGQVRQKIGVMLDPKTYPGGLATTSSGGLPLSTGNYRSLSISGSTPSIASSGAIRLAQEGIPPSAATAGGVEAAIGSEAPGAGKRKAIVAAVVVGALLGVAALIVTLSGNHAQEAAKAPPMPTATLAAAAAPIASAADTAAPPPPTSSASPPSTATAIDSSSAKAASAPPPAPQHGHGGGHHAPPRTAPPPPPPVAAAPAPTTPPVAAPTPAPQPTTKANPLEDRQ